MYNLIRNSYFDEFGARLDGTEDKRTYAEVLYSTVSKGGKAHQRLHDKCKVVSEEYQGEGLVKVGYYRQVRG